MKAKKLLVSRTDSIGDVILTLPIIGYLKQHYPNLTIGFLGRSYTAPIIKLATGISSFHNWDEVAQSDSKAQADFLASLGFDTILHVFPRPEIAKAAKAANIKTRVGTTGRLYHWHTCNKLVKFSRKRSGLHESQLNFKLLQGLGIKHIPEKHQMANFYDLEYPQISSQWKGLLKNKKFNLVIHPKSKGSAVEWPEKKYLELISRLPENLFEIFITGTAEEGDLVSHLSTLKLNHVHPLFGKMSLQELINFLGEANGVLAASTGPLHIAAALGTHAMGLYAPQKPIHPGRWAPIGFDTKVFVHNGNQTNPINAIQAISVDEVVDHLMEMATTRSYGN